MGTWCPHCGVHTSDLSFLFWTLQGGQREWGDCICSDSLACVTLSVIFCVVTCWESLHVRSRLWQLPCCMPWPLGTAWPSLRGSFPVTCRHRGLKNAAPGACTGTGNPRPAQHNAPFVQHSWAALGLSLSLLPLNSFGSQTSSVIAYN